MALSLAFNYTLSGIAHYFCVRKLSLQLDIKILKGNDHVACFLAFTHLAQLNVRNCLFSSSTKGNAEQEKNLRERMKNSKK